MWGCRMSHKLRFMLLAYLGAAGMLMAQASAPAERPLISAPTATQMAGLAPTDSDVYCAGFFTHRAIESDMIVLSSPDAGLSYEFADRNIIYLNKGSKYLKAPGGEYMLLRPIKDMDPTEWFPGQKALVSSMGTLYAEIARIQIQTVHPESSTAEILKACEPVLAGDIVVPLASRPTPPFKAVKFTDRFAPSSGKATGTIPAIKEFQAAAGAGNIVYLNMGQKQGVQVGNSLRVFHAYASPSQYLAQQGAHEYLTDIMGVPIGRKLSHDEIKSLPRTVVGEVMVLSVQEESSTAIVTYSWEDIYPGDQVELE